MHRAPGTVPRLSRLAWLSLLGFVAAWPVAPVTPAQEKQTTGRSAPAKPGPKGALILDWDDLLPEKERLQLELPDAFQHDYLSEDGPAATQRGSSATNPKLDGMTVKVPGFVVPLGMTQQGMVSEFLLVPYFGACIHVPPPPPNQIVYVRMDKAVRLRSIYDPQWITGTLQTTKKDTRVASAAYTLAGTKIEPYEY